MKYLICVLCVILLSRGNCQIIQVSSFQSASSSYSSSNIRINWTVGELFSETMLSSEVSISTGSSEIDVINVITDLEPNHKNLITISPIPFTNELIISLGENNETDVIKNISINDLDGSVIVVPFQKKHSDIILDMRNIVSGPYLLKIKTNSEIKIFKVIKR